MGPHWIELLSTSTLPRTLTRETFTTSRELEYFSEAELVTQTGHPKEDWWPLVVVKELVDNALDACEQHAAAPKITITLAGGDLTVSDNGPGISADVVRRILDYSTRTSDKQAYVSPTRGAQGNALKTMLAIPFVLGGGEVSTIVIEARGVKHVVSVSMDDIARRPSIDHQVVEFVKTEGTTVRLQASLKPSSDPQFLQDDEPEDDEGEPVEDYEQSSLQSLMTMIQDTRCSIHTPPSPWWRTELSTGLKRPCQRGGSGLQRIQHRLIGITTSVCRI